MKQLKYTEEQIAFALKQAGLGTPVNEVIRKMGITGQLKALDRPFRPSWMLLPMTKEKMIGYEKTA